MDRAFLPIAYMWLCRMPPSDPWTFGRWGTLTRFCELFFVVWWDTMTVAGRSNMLDNIYAVPVSDQYLIYAPLHHFAALTDDLAAHRIRDSLLLETDGGTKDLREIVRILNAPAEPVPLPHETDFKPAFLGLIPTRSCNLACEYCGFLAAEEPEEVMDLRLARDAIDWYLDLVREDGFTTAEVHFFGGEPFCAEDVMDFAFHYARLRAAEFGCAVRFEVATNGTFAQDRCQWAADSLDHIVLSLDGPADIQDRHRHRKDGRGSYESVARSARLLSEGANELSFRVCVTAETVGRMPGIATWLCDEFRPSSVSFEPVQPSAPSQAAGLVPPDPWIFARSFADAAWILEAHGVAPVYAAADITARRVSFCPVGQDVPIVSPDGSISACYLLEQEWQARGLDLRLGTIEHGSVLLDGEAVAAARSLNVWNKPLCARCFCKWHCAGGCHVNHVLSSTPGDYDRLCIQTRILTLRNILRALGQGDLARNLLETPGALERVVWRAGDTIAEVENQA